MIRPLDDIAGAFMLLSRLPTGWLSRTPSLPARAAWAFPVVGAMIGLLGGVAVWCSERAHLPALVAAAWTMLLLVLATGGLHEDGLADTADGLGGGATAARRLEIMRDSRIGSYGALALCLTVLLRLVAIAALAPGLAIPGLVAVGAVARGGMLATMLLLVPARPGGMAASVAGADRRLCGLGVLLAAAACLALLSPARAAAMLLATGAAVIALTATARRLVGGYTGDILGAIEQAGECAALTVLAAG